jgi:ubiquitin
MKCPCCGGLGYAVEGCDPPEQVSCSICGGNGQFAAKEVEEMVYQYCADIAHVAKLQELANAHGTIIPGGGGRIIEWAALEIAALRGDQCPIAGWVNCPRCRGDESVCKRDSMSFDRPYPNRKDKRKPYRGSAQHDRTCRNHGSCPYCKSNRQHANKKREQSAKDQSE